MHWNRKLDKATLGPASQWQLCPEWDVWLSPPLYLPLKKKKKKGPAWETAVGHSLKTKEGRQREHLSWARMENCPGEWGLCGAAKELTFDEPAGWRRPVLLNHLCVCVSGRLSSSHWNKPARGLSTQGKFVYMHVQALRHFSWLSYSGVWLLSSVGNVCFSPEKLLNSLENCFEHPPEMHIRSGYSAF